METEIELKFFVSPEFSTILNDKISNLKVLQCNRKSLRNTYFDTPDLWLRQHDIGLRIRCFDEVYVQTVKTSGRVVAGLHQRPEYNAEHHNNEPLLSLHPAEIWPQGKEIEALQSEIIPLFSTDFSRDQWLIGMADGSQIEIAFDQGSVIADDKQVPICEVELELKSGQIESLFTLARQLSEDGGMRLGNLSKAAQGYRLRFGYQRDETVALSLVDIHKRDSVESCFISSLEHALLHWHYHEQIYSERDSISALHEIYYAISLLRQILRIYGSIVPRRASAVLRQELKWLEQELRWLKPHSSLTVLLNEKGHTLRKLDARKYLVATLKEQQNELSCRDSMLKLFYSARYSGLLLDLSRWILARGWQPFLDEKAKHNMDANVNNFAEKQLDKVWDELREVFSLNDLSSQTYIDQEHRLVRDIHTGLCFARLYDTSLHHKFWIIWDDLRQGVEDLLMLNLLKEQVEHLEEEERDQLKRWLIRQEYSVLHAMEQTRMIGMNTEPYWRHHR